MPELCLPAAHADRVYRILSTNLPRYARVRVFGSRATARGLKPHSDLNLLIGSPHELPLAAIAELREAFAESNPPFSVDLLKRCDVSAAFLSRNNHNEGPRRATSLGNPHHCSAKRGS